MGLTIIRRHFAIYFLPHKGSLAENTARWQALFRSETAQAADRCGQRSGSTTTARARSRLILDWIEAIQMKYREIIAGHLSKAGWSWGCVATVDRHGLTIFVADAHCGDGKRFVVRADEKLTAFLELESVIRQFNARILR
jgi:hypothetical protein